MVRMIVTDLDDSLLRDDKTISERTITTLRKCRDKGIKLVYATGRSEAGAVPLVPDDLFDGCVHMNGAIGHIGGELVYNKLISPESYRNLLSAMAKSGIKDD